MQQHKLLIALILILAGLLGWVGYNDHPSPAYPNGELVSAIFGLMLFLPPTAAVAYLIRFIIRRWRT